MSDTVAPTPLETALRNDRAVILAAILLLTALAWAWLVWMAGDMAMPAAPAPGMDMMQMDMPGMQEIGAAAAPQAGAWTATGFILALTMWCVMMVGMMTPSAAPLILLYARVGRQAAAGEQVFAAAGWLAAGYLLAWGGFSLFAAVAQLALSDAALLTPMLASAGGLLGGSVLIVAGAYQWSPWKESCLDNCRAPLTFIQRHGGFKGKPGGALTMGFRHGLYCVGCCWGLMLLLFVAGIMNLAWIAGLAILVLLEKLVFRGPVFSRLVGTALIGGGLWMIGRDLFQAAPV